MQWSGNSLTRFIAILFAALVLVGCGDTEPDLEFSDTYDNSPLRLELPLDTLIIQWAVYLDDDGLAVPGVVYTIKQLPTEFIPELIAGGEIQLSETEFHIDLRSYGPEASVAIFEVTATVPNVSEPVEISYFQRFLVGAREMQFDWNPVEGATGYVLTQTAGYFELFPGGIITTTEDKWFVRSPVPVHLFDWQNSLFVLEACVGGVLDGNACVGEDAELQTVGYQDAAGISRFLVGIYQDPRIDNATSEIVSSQLAFGFSLAAAENGEVMAVGEIGHSTRPLEQITDCLEMPEAPEVPVDLDDETDPLVAPYVQYLENLALYNACINENSTALNSGAVQIIDIATNEYVTLKSPNVDLADFFGSAVAISDDGLTLAVAAFGESSDAVGIFTEIDSTQNNDSLYSGAVYVYTNNSDVWELEAYIKASLSAEDYLFGLNISLSGDGNTLAVSTTSDDSDPQAAMGAAYVFTRDAGIWTESALLKGGEPDQGAFGHTLELSGDGQYLAVSSLGGALSRATSPLNLCSAETGRVFIFARELDAWQQTDVITAPNSSNGDCFGRSMSFDQEGSLLVIGAPFEDTFNAGVVFGTGSSNGGSANVGAAYLFERSAAGIASSWSSKNYYFKASTPNNQAAFGWGVSMSSDGQLISVAAIRDGATSAGVNGNQSADTNTNSGAAYVFSAGSGSDNWRQVAFVKSPTPFRNQFFGAPIEFADAGNMLAIAGNGFAWDGTFTGSPGAVYLY